MTSNRSKNLALFPEATNTRAAVALTFLGGLGDREYDESDLPRLNGGPRPLHYINKISQLSATQRAKEVQPPLEDLGFRSTTFLEKSI